MHTVNKKILFLSEDAAQETDDTITTAEAKYSNDFTKSKKKKKLYYEVCSII